MNRREFILSSTASVAALTALGANAAFADTPASKLETGRYTYDGSGTVNTHWIETSNGVIVIDVQRDLTHAGEALAAVKRIGKPVLALLITHGHPDHYAGVGLFKQAFPKAEVWASRATDETIANDPYGYNSFMRKAAPGNFPESLVRPDHVFERDAEMSFDGVRVLAREMGKAEANSATAYYVPETGDLYVGDLVLHRMHALLTEGATTDWMAALDRLAVLFPKASTVHPGHGASGDPDELLAGQRDYLTTFRKLTAMELANSIPAEVAVPRIAAAISTRFATYGYPAGLPDLIGISARALYDELAQPALHAVR